MKKFIFSVILILFFIPGIKVSADECTNLLDIENANWYLQKANSGDSYLFYSLDGATVSYLSSQNINYTFWLDDGTHSFDSILSTYSISKIYLKYFSSAFTPLFSENFYTFKWNYGTNSNQFVVSFLGSFSNLSLLKEKLDSNEIKVWLVEGDSVCQPTVIEPPEEPIVADTTLDSFYSIYFEKLTSLSNFATENKFILSAITILIFICCLELFLYLVRRRKWWKN